MNRNNGLWLLAPMELQAQGIEEIRSDVLNIANRLAEEVDPNLGLFINQATGQYEVRYENPKTGASALVCQVAPEDLDARLINNLKSLDMWRNDLNSKKFKEEQAREASIAEAKRKAEMEEIYQNLQEELEGRLSERESLKNMVDKQRGIIVPRSVNKKDE